MFFSWQANKDTKYGFKPIEIAALNGRNEIFCLLLKVVLLAQYVTHTRFILVNIFLKNGARINYETLKNAVVGGHLETGMFSKTGGNVKTGEVRLKHMRLC